jgi:hypothetical protein
VGTPRTIRVTAVAPFTVRAEARTITLVPLLFERKRELFTVRRVSAVGGTMRTIYVGFDTNGH